ncbi:MAG: hypothetical protein NC254_04170 [bacterium]|nr:hypothetical protein [bacterium]
MIVLDERMCLPTGSRPEQRQDSDIEKGAEHPFEEFLTDPEKRRLR